MLKSRGLTRTLAVRAGPQCCTVAHHRPPPERQLGDPPNSPKDISAIRSPDRTVLSSPKRPTDHRQRPPPRWLQTNSRFGERRRSRCDANHDANADAHEGAPRRTARACEPSGRPRLDEALRPEKRKVGGSIPPRLTTCDQAEHPAMQQSRPGLRHSDVDQLSPLRTV